MNWRIRIIVFHETTNSTDQIEVRKPGKRREKPCHFVNENRKLKKKTGMNCFAWNKFTAMKNRSY